MPKPIPHPTPSTRSGQAPNARILTQIGRRVASRRGELGLSQRVLAQMMDVSPLLVQNIEHGRSNFTFNTLLKLTTALGVSPAALLDGAM